jgi:hypothetical protein
MIRHIYIILGLVIIPPAYCVVEYGHTGMQMVLVQTGLSCPHAHSRLIVSLPSAVWTVYRHRHSLFPTHAVWLGCPNLGAWLGILASHMTHITGLSHRHSMIGNTHITLLARVGRTCTCHSVGHNNHHHFISWSLLKKIQAPYILGSFI